MNFSSRLYLHLVFLGLAIFCFNFLSTVILASDSEIKVKSASAESEFPEGIRFSVQAISNSRISEIAVNFRIGQQISGVYEYLDFEDGLEVEGSLFWKTNTGSKYVPPGTIIEYSFSISDESGNTFDSENKYLVYSDTRFEWQEVELGTISVAYHGPVKSRAEDLLDAMNQTLYAMEPVFGDVQGDPIRVTMYNNVAEMMGALPPSSSTIRSELITEGQAYPDIGTVLVLGGGRLSRGTASHEVTHILVHRAGDSVFSSIPSWLNEGLAEFGNVSPSFSYDVALDFAVHADRLMPITSMRNRPGDPEDVIIFYGSASSIVEFMIYKFGPDKMLNLLTEHKSGRNMDDSIEFIYGITKLELENQWRNYIGAPAYEPELLEKKLPTPIPRPTVGLFSLTPQSGSYSIKSTEIDTSENLSSYDEPNDRVSTDIQDPDAAQSTGCNRLDRKSSVTDYAMFLLIIPPLLIWSRRR